MKKIRLLIVDDEAPARAVIRNYLKEYPEAEIVAECSNGFEALKLIQQETPDLIFLDVQMPKITGFEMLELLEEKPVTVFCTAYDQYALQAFEASAADYLLKPFSPARFAEAWQRASLFLRNKSGHEETIEKLMRHHEAQIEYLQRIVVKIGSQIKIIPVTEIFWLEAQDDYVMLHTQDDALLKQKRMKFFEEHLNPKDFVRIHRSHIVRINFIKQIELIGKESYKAELKNGKRLPVSKRGHVALKELLQ